MNLQQSIQQEEWGKLDVVRPEISRNTKPEFEFQLCHLKASDF